MKTLFLKKHFSGSRSIFMLCIFPLSFLAVPARAQEQNRRGLEEHTVLYGFHLSFTENRVNLYYTQNGEAHTLEQGNHSFYVPGFRFAVMGEIRLGRCFSLRAMPGMAYFGRSWEPGNIPVSTLPSADYKVESVFGELPIDVKFHPFRMGDMQPYIFSGPSYSFDLISLRKDSDNGSIQRLNAHDLRYTCGLGLDWYTRHIKVGMELKASFGLLSPDTKGTNHDKPFYFQGGPTFCIGFNIEA
ncbi:MAG: PorT protein [bacterium P3]|nr:MAG: PorT protein [bacterium P3]KWW34143.1 MAG: PorT protein [bacterium F083]